MLLVTFHPLPIQKERNLISVFSNYKLLLNLQFMSVVAGEILQLSFKASSTDRAEILCDMIVNPTWRYTQDGGLVIFNGSYNMQVSNERVC